MIQTLEDTTKRNVVSPLKGSGLGRREEGGNALPCPSWLSLPLAPPLQRGRGFLGVSCFESAPAPLQVRTIVTETSFTIDELEELYALFKVSFKVNSCPFEGMKRTWVMKRSLNPSVSA